MKMHILIAEDDRNFSLVLKSELEAEGYTVDLAGNGVNAVLRFIDNRYKHDFILLDIKMPSLDGINALRIIKRLNDKVPAITFSGNAGSGEMAESVKAGALRCLTKPFEISQLRDEIEKYNSRRRSDQL
jgi:DNA-binding response OmpR family regulator